MLKLPPNLPALEQPHFILATPLWQQLIVLLVFLLAVPLLALGWVVWLMSSGQAGSTHYAQAGVMVLLLAGGLHRRNWRRWVVFAADRHGVYLGSFRGPFHHVPWDRVGPSSIDIAGIGSNRQRTVILPLKVDETTWAALLGGRRRRVNAPADGAGFRPFGIGKAGQSVLETQRQIELLRPG